MKNNKGVTSIIIIVIAVIILLASTLAGFIYYQNYQKNKKIEILTKQKDALENLYKLALRAEDLNGILKGTVKGEDLIDIYTDLKKMALETEEINNYEPTKKELKRCLDNLISYSDKSQKFVQDYLLIEPNKIDQADLITDSSEILKVGKDVTYYCERAEDKVIKEYEKLK